jgi:flagellar basal body-associated protein FliL
MDDIEREKADEQREDMKKKIVTDINDVFGNVIKKRKDEREQRKKKRKWWVKLLLALLSLGLFLLVLNFVLGNIWLLKFFVKDLFHIK